MAVLEHRALGVAVIVLGCLPLFEFLIRHSLRLRGDPARNTRQQNPTKYLVVMLFAVLLAAAASLTGIAIFAGAVPF